jgi:hypothetical protein
MTVQPAPQIQANEPSQQASPPASDAFVVPDAYKDRGWVEKVKSPDDLWKTLDNAQSLLGKRPAGIPANDAPDAEWEAFYKVARPESADKYTLSDIEGLPEGVDLTPYKADAQKLMFEAGLTQRQADALWKQYVGIELGAVGKTQEALDKRYDEIAPKVLGEKHADLAKVALDALNELVDADYRTSFVNNPEGMVAFIQTVNKLQEKHSAELAKVRAEYGAEGKLPDGGQQVPAVEINDVVTKQAKLRISAAAQDFTHPDHKKTMDEIKALEAVVARHYNR